MIPRTPMARAGLSANVLALSCIVIAFIKRDQATVEGAYFDRSVGGDSLVVSTANLTPWLIAAAVLLVLGTAALVADSKRGSG